MRKCLLAVLAAGVTLATSVELTARAASPSAAKPLAVLSATGFETLVGHADAIRGLTKAPHAPAWFESVVRLFSEGDGLAGLDRGRPWGAVVQIDGEKLSAYAFVPVTSAEMLHDSLSAHISSVSDCGGGVYHVVGSKGAKQLYAKVVGDEWIFVSKDADALADVPNDPSKLLAGMNEQYDFAVRLNVENLPSDRGEKLLESLRRQAEDKFAVSTLVSQDTLDMVLGMAGELDQVTFGWTPHR